MNTIKEFMTHVVNTPRYKPEEWKYISHPDIDATAYKVSNLGRVRNAKSKRLIAPQQNKCGYWFVSLINKRGTTTSIALHILVARHFLPPPQDGQSEVDHIDGNPFHNEADNLRWCTHKENLHNVITRLRMVGDLDVILAPVDYEPHVTAPRASGKRYGKPPVRVICTETGVIYASLSDAAKAYNTSYRWIIASYKSGAAIGEQQHHFKPVDPYQGNA